MKYYYSIIYYARNIGGAVLYESNLLFDNKENAMLVAHQVCKKNKCFFKLKQFKLLKYGRLYNANNVAQIRQ